MRGRHPSMRDIASDFKRSVGDIAALGDDLAEFGGAALDQIVALAIFPDGSRWGGQAQARHRPGWLQPPILPCPTPRVDAQADDIADPVGVDALDPEHIVDGLTMRPCLHQAGGNRA